MSKDWRGIWVVAEHRRGALLQVTGELLGAARQLGEASRQEVAAVLCGYEVEKLAGELFAWGADRVYLVDDPRLADNVDDYHAEAVAKLIQEERPSVVLVGGTFFGRSLAPRVAARLRTGLTADATEVELDPESGLLRLTKPSYGGNVMAIITCPERRPQMATIRPRALPVPQREAGRQGVVERRAFTPAQEAKMAILEAVSEGACVANLADARVIVAGGRGLGDPKNFKLLEELAAVLGGAVAASRAVTDLGWYPASCLVGQTGITVAPRLYIACGISGAVQHVVGMRRAGTIVAINKDPHAPIFEIAHYGIVGDVLEVVPALTAELRRRLGR